MATKRYEGSCHCGLIHFSFESEVVAKGVRCNCSFCAKRGTLVHLVSSDAEFKLDAAVDALSFYQFGPKKAKHYFCKNCGIHTFTETTKRPGCHIVNLGCIEEIDTYSLETTVFDGKTLF